MSNIFDTNISFDQANSYQKHEFVLYNSVYYYALKDIPANTAFSLDNWGGVITFQGIEKPRFLWTPDYGSETNTEPNVAFVQFGDGYSQRFEKNINSDLLSISYRFTLRKVLETTAICHFFKRRTGVESFVFTPSSPFQEQKLFICRKWAHIEVFYNNHTIRAVFEEVAA